MIYKCSSLAWCQWMVHTFWAAPAMFCLSMTWGKCIETGYLVCRGYMTGIVDPGGYCRSLASAVRYLISSWSSCTLAHISPTFVYIYYYQVCKLCSIEQRSIDLHFCSVYRYQLERYQLETYQFLCNQDANPMTSVCTKGKLYVAVSRWNIPEFCIL